MSNGKTRIGGRWIRDDTWLPWRYDSYQEWDRTDHPEVIVRNWGFVRTDVDPVVVFAYGWGHDE